MTPQQQALSIVRNEHITLIAVIDALKYVATDVAAGKLTPDYKLLWSILYYIEEFPERLHHPKEDAVLFPRLRARTADINATLDELERQHVNSQPALDRLKAVLGRMEADIPGAKAEFAERCATYAGFHRQHMALEEAVVLSKATEVFTDQDWVEVAQAFAQNKDPLRNGAVHDSDWFRQFYRHIVALVPEPWGVGERK
ncbi:hemerythrin domain-containing protein [Curvibacter sp. CHRR-16]|uniref:hemerythrin domain-containing protein n=1 Tax=Curvibacter sp. CHRR-16 TaxID=2835872 RepID=UPI001BDA093D|nr:hemerythrin domain-containing protein [Curvibacter sp. CHRR-16]MBT0568846.1 hemerythrin domain-containing protein [Curvibacter sp. CHRR-16]